MAHLEEMMRDDADKFETSCRLMKQTQNHENYEGSTMMRKHGMMKTNERSRKNNENNEKMRQFQASIAFKSGVVGGHSPHICKQNDPRSFHLVQA